MSTNKTILPNSAQMSQQTPLDSQSSQIIYPIRFAAGEIARVSGPNWAGWLVILLQECERLTTPEHFAGILKSLHAHIGARLETGGWL